MKKVFIAAFLVSSLLTSCKETGKSNETEKGTSKKNEKVEETRNLESPQTTKSVTTNAICLLEKLSIRETPSSKGKWITSMSLGEKVAFTGEEITDSKSKKIYYKVKLIDGKEGWTRATFLAVNGKVGAMLEPANVYKRPDLLTKTEKKYSVMDIIAVTENQGDWMKVKGKRAEGEYIEEGWIKSSNITNDEIDIATAKFASLAMKKPTMTDRIKALQEVLNNSDLSSSKFVNLIQDKIKDYQSRNKEIDVKDVKVEEAPNS